MTTFITAKLKNSDDNMNKPHVGNILKIKHNKKYVKM